MSATTLSRGYVVCMPLELWSPSQKKVDVYIQQNLSDRTISTNDQNFICISKVVWVPSWMLTVVVHPVYSSNFFLPSNCSTVPCCRIARFLVLVSELTNHNECQLAVTHSVYQTKNKLKFLCSSCNMIY